MGLLDLLRQVYLLLWKNYTLRKRKKIRLLVEIIWPLFLFLILMWVRTRGLKSLESQCYFGERPLPSSGMLPFLRGYVCELNFSCSHFPRQSMETSDFYKLTSIGSDLIDFLNDSTVSTFGDSLNDLLNQTGAIRSEAAQITGNLTLSQVLLYDTDTFKQKINDLNITGLNDTVIDLILNSTPNFNYLYSNLSTAYNEPLILLSLANTPQNLINILYGPDLDLIDLFRSTNQVNNSNWIRKQICLANANNLLKSNQSENLNQILCSLSDAQLALLFSLISTSIDFTKAKQSVTQNIDLYSNFYSTLMRSFNSFRQLQQAFQQSNAMNNNDLNLLSNIFNNLQNVTLEKAVCGDSQLSLFTIFNAISITLSDDETGSKKRMLSSTTSSLLSSKEKISELARSIFDDEINYDSAKHRPDEYNYRMRSLKNIRTNYKQQIKADQQINKARQIDITSNGDTNSTSTNAETSTPGGGGGSGSSTSTKSYAYLKPITKLFAEFNSLKNIDPAACPVDRSDADLDPSVDLYVNSTTKSCFCQTFYYFLNEMSYSIQVLFAQIRPIFLGKILYAPNIPAYQNLIKRMNSTFENADKIAALVGNFGQLAKQITQQLSSTTNLNNIQMAQALFQQVLNDYANINLNLPAINLTNLIIQMNYISELLIFSSNSLYCIELDRFQGYPNESQAVKVGLDLINKESFWAAIIFQNSSAAETSPDDHQLPKIVNYKIRMNSSLTHDTTYTQPRFYTFGPQNCIGCNSYFFYGFIYLQDLLEKSIIESKTNLSQDFGITTQMTPYPCYINDKFVTNISRSLPLFMVIAWIYTISMMVKDIVYEKEKRLKEFMRVMGLTNATHWFAWFITSFITMFMICIFLCLIIKYGKIIQYSDLIILLIFFCCFTIATITECFLISVFFNRANLAAVVAGIVYFILYLPYTILLNYSDSITGWQKFLASLSSTVAFGYGCEIIATYEVEAKGIQWSNFYKSPYLNNDGFSMNAVCLIMLFDAFIYLVLTWYIESIAPGEFGIPKPWYFPVNPTYWFGDRIKFKIFNSKSNQDDENNDNNEQPRNCFMKIFKSFFIDKKKKIIEEEIKKDEASDKKRKSRMIDNIEKLQNESELVAGIEIDQLHKVYTRGNNHALKGLSIKFYENEISAFLGHNGAGKSTTMHILTGLYTPTAGKAKINGLEITESMDQIRKSLGFVPQHNVLFPGMTVGEHLWFYARLKGLNRSETLKEMDKMLEDTGLEPKRNELSKNLSGGMKRKLSVAIAFVGKSKTVILDEPSAGVDPSGRRSIWDLLFKYRPGRTIIISTHHMDEADILGDRIAIISNGKLIAHGTSYFLKHKFGRGYYLTFAKKPMVENALTNQLLVKSDYSAESPNLRSSTSSLSDSGHGSLSAETSDSTVPSTNPSALSQQDKRITQILEEANNEEKDDLQLQLENEKNLINSLATKQDKNINYFIKERLKNNAILIASIGSEMTYSISNKKEFTKNYDKFFKELESNMDSLGIESMGISDTTLEEIFIKLAKEPTRNSFQEPDRKICGISLNKIKNNFNSIFAKSKTAKLSDEQLTLYSTYTKQRVSNMFIWLLQQLYALLVKRFQRVKRNIKGFFAEIVLPVVFVCLALLVATMIPTVRERPSLELHPWYYGQPNQVFVSKSSSLSYDRPIYSDSYIDNVYPQQQSNIKAVNNINQMFLDYGLGTRCIKGHQIVITKQIEDNSRALGNTVLECEGFSNQLLQNFTLPTSEFISGLNSLNFSFTKRSLDCNCSGGFPDCPLSAGGDINYRPIYKLKSQDILYDLTSRNVSDWLIKTEFDDQFFRKRYGGYEFLVPFVNDNNQLAINSFNGFQNLLVSLNNYLSVVLNSTNSNSSSSSSSSSSPSSLLSQGISFSGTNPLVANQNVKIWYNTKGYDANVAYLNVINNAILRSKITYLNEMKQLQANSSEYLDPSEHGIVAHNHPMNYTKTQFFDQLEKRVLTDLFVAICIIFALSFIPASFLVFLLEERENNSKQLQFVSGVKPYIYWISNFIWDLINYIVPIILCLIIFVIFEVQAYMTKENFPCLVCLMLLYGWACVPLMYPLNYIFNVPSTAFVLSSSLNVFIGIISTVTTTVLEQLGEDDADLLQVNEIIKPIFIVLFPHYCLGQGFLQMSILYNTAEVKRSFGIPTTYNPFEFNKVGRNLLAMSLQGIVYFTINLLIEYKLFIRIKPTEDVSKLRLPPIENEDDDVLREKFRILNNEMMAKANRKKFNLFRFGSKDKVKNKVSAFLPENQNDRNDYDDTTNDQNNTGTDYIRLVNLTKIYKKLRKFRIKKHVAVNAISVGINKGECFGLIGVNGAGKTTTFKMITGDIRITGGDVYVNGYSCSKEIEKVHRNIGYCPQSDAIMPLLTAREHLIFFARLRGIPEKYVKKVSEWALNRVGLTVFADRISGDFSGGNKRKLSTAIALVGDPSVICLDEPTSGMDAKARRLLWNDILSLMKENRIVILTSHTMEECEALCTRLVIMVNGVFKCLGSPQHLKSKFGSGYKLSIRLNDENDKEKAISFMRRNFPTSIVQDTHRNLLEYTLPFNDTKLSRVFESLERNRSTLNLKDYSINQTTLDQIFVNFAKAQNDEPFVDMEQVMSVPEIASNSNNINDVPEAIVLGKRLSVLSKQSNGTFASSELFRQQNDNRDPAVDAEIGLRSSTNLSNRPSTRSGDSDTKNPKDQYYFDSNNNLARESEKSFVSINKELKNVINPLSFNDQIDDDAKSVNN